MYRVVSLTSSLPFFPTCCFSVVLECGGVLGQPEKPNANKLKVSTIANYLWSIKLISFTCMCVGTMNQLKSLVEPQLCM